MALCLLSLVSFCISIWCIKTMKISSPAFCFQQQSTAALMQMTGAGITAVNRISSPLMSSALSGAPLWVHQHMRVTPTQFPGENLPRLVVTFILKFSKQRRRRNPRRSSRPADSQSLGLFRPRRDEGVCVRSRKWLLFHVWTKTGARIPPMTVSIAANRSCYRPGREIGFPKGQHHDPSTCHRWFSPSSESVLTHGGVEQQRHDPLRDDQTRLRARSLSLHVA